ncbi:MAG TPA: gamma-glutamyltransferase, partial [Acidimicrobiales bacterium]|nr:gamma-glutamyltransferase [Acidimicrobiales bacterium]
MCAFTTRPELLGTYGMVASTHWLASAAGMRLLERGGNAFDAAVAAGFTLQVVEPHLNGPGGDLPVIFWSRQLGRPRVLCGQGVAPASATIRAFEDLGLPLIPGEGLLPACVPGAFDAWLLLLRDFGTMPLADVLEVAIAYAGDGYPVVPGITHTIAGVEKLFREEWTDSAALYLRDGVPQPGGIFRNQALAGVYRRIVSEAERAGSDRDKQIETARDLFYRGFVADEITSYLGTAQVMDSSGRRHRALLGGEDLAGWAATYEDPVTFCYDGMTVCKTGPWGQGPVLLQQLALLADFDLASMGLGSDEFMHTVVECAKLAFADREAWYGDPDLVPVPMDALLSPEYNASRRKLVTETASLELRPGWPLGLSPTLPPVATSEGTAATGQPALGV